MRVRTIVYLSVAVLFSAGLLFGGYRLYHKLRYGEQLTVRNETDVVVVLRSTNPGDTVFGEDLLPHTTRTINAGFAFGHPESIYIDVHSQRMPGYREQCTWADARRHHPLVVTYDGAACGEMIRDQPVSPLQ